jgi:putative spermidine/putrescine transport system substrate-binding protein
VVPYVMSLVKGGPHPEQGKAVLDYVLSDKGQSLWAEAFLRPVRANAMSPAAKAKFLPDADYARARAVDFKAMAAAQDAFKAAYLAEVR